MVLSEIIEALELVPVVAGENPDQEITGCYVSDLLSDVMAHAEEGQLWVTLQTHVNTVAVAVLKDLAGIVIVNSRPLSDDTKAKAEAEGIWVMSTRLETFDVAGKLYALGLGK